MYIRLCVKNALGFSKYTVKYLKGYCVCNLHPNFQKETYIHTCACMCIERRERK